jgi:hypothetical protein
MTSWAAEEVWGQDWAEKKKVFFSLLKTSQNRRPYLSYKSSRKNHEKSVKSSCFVLFQVSPHREKKSTDSCVLPKKKGEGCFPKWRRYSRYSNKNKIKQVRFSSMVSASL